MADAKPKNVEEVIVFFAERCRTGDEAKKWYYLNDAVGWMQGKNKIVNWKSAASYHILQLIDSNTKEVQDLFMLVEMQERLRKYNETKLDEARAGKGDGLPKHSPTRITGVTGLHGTKASDIQAH